MTTFDQADYQVRFDWGRAGLARLAPGDVVVLVTVLGSPDPDLVDQAAARGAPVLLGGLTDATAVATECLRLQHERGERTSVVVLAGAGSPDDGGRPPAATSGTPTHADAAAVEHGARFAVEDLLGAGAVIAALAERGTDHTSPEAAAACEAFLGLRRAVGHLVSASGTGRLLTAQGHGDRVAAAAQLDSTAVVTVLLEGGLATLEP